MLAACAADCNREVRSLTSLVQRDPSTQHGNEIVGYVVSLGVGFEKGFYFGRLPAEGTQLWLPVRIGKHAHVEHKVSVYRRTFFEPKRLHLNRHRIRGSCSYAFGHDFPLLVRGHFTGVDYEIGSSDKWLENNTFECNGIR
jgi:hypothetical protein